MLTWWSVKALRASWWSRLAWIPIFGALFMLALGVVGGGTLAGWAAAAVLAVGGSFVLVFGIGAAVWVGWIVAPNAAVYLSARRDAVLVVHLRRNGRAELTNHVASSIGRGIGARFRAEIVPPLIEWLAAAGIEGVATSTSSRLRGAYLQEWTQHGLTRDGHHALRLE